MTREELYDLMQLIPALLKTGDGYLKSQQAYDRKIHEFIAKHIEPPQATARATRSIPRDGVSLNIISPPVGA